MHCGHNEESMFIVSTLYFPLQRDSLLPFSIMPAATVQMAAPLNMNLLPLSLAHLSLEPTVEQAAHWV